MKHNVYIAAPFFNDYQLSVLEQIKDVLEKYSFDYFSPRDNCLYEPGKTTPEEIMEQNVSALKETTLLVCVTDGKDPGTMFEAGWAYANQVPIIYIWLTGTPEQKFNLVLAASGAVVRSISQLERALLDTRENGFKMVNWSTEEINYE